MCSRCCGIQFQEEKEEDFGTGFCAPTQRQLWNLFENPHHSKAAKGVAIVSCLFVVVSTLCLIFSTLPSFQQQNGSGKILIQLAYLAHIAVCFRGRILLWSGRSSFCWLVLLRIRHQICGSTSEISVSPRVTKLILQGVPQNMLHLVFGISNPSKCMPEQM